MNKSLLFFALFLLIVLLGNAQTDYSDYLNKALKELEDGNCDAAQKFYDVYKELSGKTVTSVEVLLADCGGKEKTYKVGDFMKVGDEKYQVAYIRDGGKHGLAVLNKGWQSMSGKRDIYITRKGIPTLEEMKLIYSNRDIVRLYDIYWTCTKKETGSSSYMIYDFSTGKIGYAYEGNEKGIILLVFRF